MPKNNACFICGTDTGVGKPLVCAGLLLNKPDISALHKTKTTKPKG